MAPRQRTYLGNSFCFWHLRFAFVRFAKFAACRFGLIGGEIVHCRAERDRWKIRLLAIGPGARDKPDDVDAHERSSQTAIAIRPTSASEIRYAVIGFFSVNEMCGMITVWSAIISGANRIPG